MADRELRINEKRGIMIQHYNNGDTGIIKYSDANGYVVDWIAGGVTRFLPYSKVDEYVVIE